MNLKLRRGFAAVVVAGIALSGTGAGAETRFRIGTGGVAGIYNQIGASICRFLKKNPEEHGLRCRTKITAGSVANLQGLRAGSLELAVVQSDVQHQAYTGTEAFAGAGAHGELRALFSVVPEVFTVVAGREAEVAKLEDLLSSKRVSVGAPGSGGRVVLDALMRHLGWTLDDFRSAVEIRTSVLAEQICDRKIDVAVSVLAHPNLTVQDAAASCEATLVPMAGPEIDAFVAANRHFVTTSIPGGLYAANPDPVPSFGVTATVVTTSATSPETVYQVVKAVFENLEEFKTLLPVFAKLDRTFMLAPHHAAPWHPGALRYFRETGMM